MQRLLFIIDFLHCCKNLFCDTQQLMNSESKLFRIAPETWELHSQYGTRTNHWKSTALKQEVSMTRKPNLSSLVLVLRMDEVLNRMISVPSVNAWLSFEHAERVIATTNLILLAVCLYCHRKVQMKKDNARESSTVGRSRWETGPSQSLKAAAPRQPSEPRGYRRVTMVPGCELMRHCKIHKMWKCDILWQY